MAQFGLIVIIGDTPANYNHATNGHAARAQHVLYRQEVVNRLQQQHALVILITDNFCAFMELIRSTYSSDVRYSHVLQV